MKTWDDWLFSFVVSAVSLAAVIGLGVAVIGLGVALIGWLWVDLYTYYQCQVNLNQAYCDVREFRGG